MSEVPLPNDSSIRARVRAEWALPMTRFVLAIVFATALAMWWLERFHVVAKQPLWLLVVALGLGYVLSWTTHLVYSAAPSRGRLQIRIAVQVAVATVLMYLTGWGPALALGYVFIARDNLTVASGFSWRVIAAWVAAGLAVGELTSAWGWRPASYRGPTSTA